jgi:hypothetical protein
VHAEPLIRQALALRDPQDVRERALLLIDLAMTYLLVRELDQAFRAGEQAVKLVERVRLSASLAAQMRTLRARAEAFPHSEAARRLAARLAGALEPATALGPADPLPPG